MLVAESIYLGSEEVVPYKSIGKKKIRVMCSKKSQSMRLVYLPELVRLLWRISTAAIKDPVCCCVICFQQDKELYTKGKLGGAHLIDL